MTSKTEIEQSLEHLDVIEADIERKREIINQAERQFPPAPVASIFDTVECTLAESVEHAVSSCVKLED